MDLIYRITYHIHSIYDRHRGFMIVENWFIDPIKWDYPSWKVVNRPFDWKIDG